jgi:hypothetical protein
VAGRNEAILLEASFSALPAGSLFHEQQQQQDTWSRQQHCHWQQQLAGQAALAAAYECAAHAQQQRQHHHHNMPGALTQQLVQWQQELSRGAQQLGQQVALHCVEHGRSVCLLQERCAEVAHSLLLGASALHTQHTALAAALRASVAQAHAADASIAHLQQQLLAAKCAAQQAADDLAVLRAAHEQLEQDSQLSSQLLQQDVVRLRQRLYDERAEHERAQLEAANAAAEAADAASERLAAAEQEAADLQQRLGHAHAQLAALRCGCGSAVVWRLCARPDHPAAAPQCLPAAQAAAAAGACHIDSSCADGRAGATA